MTLEELISQGEEQIREKEAAQRLAASTENQSEVSLVQDIMQYLNWPMYLCQYTRITFMCCRKQNVKLSIQIFKGCPICVYVYGNTLCASGDTIQKQWRVESIHVPFYHDEIVTGEWTIEHRSISTLTEALAWSRRNYDDFLDMRRNV